MWFRNVKEAFLLLFVWEGLLAFLVQIDRLGNALTGGNPLTTISGRTGFYSIARNNPYWKMLEKIINFSFYPIEGKDHCYRAWVYEKEWEHRRGNDVGLFFLSLVVILACLPISLFTYGSTLWDGLIGLLQKQ